MIVALSKIQQSDLRDLNQTSIVAANVTYCLQQQRLRVYFGRKNFLKRSYALVCQYSGKKCGKP